MTSALPATVSRWWPLALALVLAASAAIWEVDPRWITENVDGLVTREQGVVNQESLNGPQRIAIVAVPVSLLAMIVGLAVPERRPAGSSVDWLGLWVLWSLLGAIVGPEPLQAFGFSAATAAVIFGSRRLARHSATLMAATIVGAMVAFVTLSLLVKFVGLSDLSVREGRLTLLSLEANQFGRMASLAGLAGVYLALETRALPLRLFGTCSAVVAIAALAMTGSRTGLLATAAAVGVLVLTKRSKATFLGLAGVGLLAGFALIVSNVGRASLGALLRDSDSTESLQSLTGRTNVWPVVLDQIGARPLTGHGFGSTTTLLSPRSGEAGFTVEHAHNLWLHLLLTTGLIGLVLIVIAIARAVRRAEPDNRPWVLAFLTYFLIAGISEAILRNPDISLMALVFMLVLAEPRSAAAEPDDRPSDCVTTTPPLAAAQRGKS